VVLRASVQYIIKN